MANWRGSLLVVALGVLLVACGGGGRGGGGNGGDGEDLPTAATVTSEDERVPHPLAAGRYRLAWDATDCRPSLLITDATTEEPVYENESPSVRVLFVQELPSGEFFIEQVNPECSEWSITLTRF